LDAAASIALILLSPRRRVKLVIFWPSDNKS
jgi:hypothetical protein